MCFATTILAQQVPMVSHYYFNKFLYNPALAGIEEHGQAYLLYRNQWNAIPGAPKTKAFTMDGPLKSNKVGIGVSLYQDNAGQFNSTGGKLSYRYGLQLAKDQYLNMGLSLGFLDNRIDFDRLDPKHLDDPLIALQGQSTTGFDATFGLSYQMKKLNIGFTVPQVLANKLVYDNLKTLSDIEYDLVRHYIATVRYDFTLSEKLTFEPVAMLRATPQAPVQYDINAMFNYDEKLWFGAMYRSQYAASASVAAKFFGQIMIGYSYDLAVNAYRQYMRGAHEVMLGYQFGGESKENRKLIDAMDKDVKMNKEDILKNRKDIDSNDEDIEELDKDAEERDEEIKNIKDEVEKLKTDFTDFKTKVENGTVSTGETISFKNVYFETNSSSIKGVKVSELDNLAKIMLANPSMEIAIVGHADKRASDEFNSKLSEKRSKSVRNYLISKGVDGSRLVSSFVGEGNPISDDLSLNRRVEFTVLKK